MASQRRLRRKQCADKIKHSTEADAAFAAFLLRREKGALLQPYKCRFCHHWHLGHTRSQRRREGLRRMFGLDLIANKKTSTD
jgi:hypothetical protein